MNTQHDLSRLRRAALLRGAGVRRIAGALLPWLLFSTAALAAAADQPAQVWLLSTRDAPLCGDLEAGRSAIQYWRLDRDHAWQAADAADFHRGDQRAMPATVFIHGNRIDPDTAVEQGWRLYPRMCEEAAGRPFRLVLWSWPSERIKRGVRHDVWQKVEFSDAQSYYLARFLADFQPDAPVSLIGYSLGARVATGAMELLAGGSIADRRLPDEVVVRRARQHPRPFRVVLTAAACDADWLLPGHRDGQALSLINRMLVTTDARDPAMKWYSRLYGRGGPEALGCAGPCCLPQPGSCGKIELIDVSCSVGRRHDWDLYAAAPELDEHLGWYTFLAPSGSAPGAAEATADGAAGDSVP
jgi:esterase/lipase superfamily enzyme